MSEEGEGMTKTALYEDEILMMQFITTTHGQANGRCLENHGDGGHRGLVSAVCSCLGERAAGWLALVFWFVRGARRQTSDGAARPGPMVYATYVSRLQFRSPYLRTSDYLLESK